MKPKLDVSRVKIYAGPFTPNIKHKIRFNCWNREICVELAKIIKWSFSIFSNVGAPIYHERQILL